MGDEKESKQPKTPVENLFFQKKNTVPTISIPAIPIKNSDNEKTEVAQIPSAIEKTEVKEVKQPFVLPPKTIEEGNLEEDSTFAGISPIADEENLVEKSNFTLSIKQDDSDNSLLKKCHICHEIISGTWCESCGTALQRRKKTQAKSEVLETDTSIRCNNCGLKTKHNICPNCGNRISLPLLSSLSVKKR